ncbi:PHD finger protein 20 isoform X3 [Denticeps clupeoides]|uniref:PHD finger protein 20 isoform X3 n=1 Tax=Denticeps clupeoides TaxID=299321 RepID=UPI0010A3AF73|nr:PHD finger protein 20-like isoform X3 [Denticeps clupeoides]
MSKTPPNRRGITFEVGAQLEARDSLKNWYIASIEKIDYDHEKVLIHYRQWSHRYDEWFDWTSPYLRPVERIQLRREGLQDDCCGPVFHVNDKVLASWSDCRFYPAKVLAVNKDAASYMVKFFDGVIRTVKGSHVKPFVRKRGARTRDRNGESHLEGKPLNGKDGTPRDHGGPKGNKTHNTSDQDSKSSSENEEDEDHEEWHQDDMEEEADPSCGSLRTAEDQNKNVSETQKDGVQFSVQREEFSPEVRKHLRLENMSENPAGQHSEKCNGLKGEIVKIERDPDGGAATRNMEELKAEEDLNPKAEVCSGPAPLLAKRTRGRGTAGPCAGKEGGSESRKRRSTVERAPPSKKSKGDACSGAAEKAPSEPASHKLPETGTECVSAQSPSGAEAESVPPAKPVRKQGFHNPNRFSREPLYRVIKNQPPPVLSIDLDHNPFKCSAPGCTKSFRKAKLLHYHMKYYHGEEKALELDLGPTAGELSRAADPMVQERKRRRTMSASLHPSLHNPKNAARPDNRTSSQSTANTTSRHPHLQQQQSSLLREKSKENQAEKIRRQMERAQSPGGLASVKEQDKVKEKKFNFLRIKFKKKKKKKVNSERTGSEENIAISLCQLQSKLCLPIKLPTSHKHKPEAYGSRPGHCHSPQIHVDDEDSSSDWSTDSCGWSEDDAECDVKEPSLCRDSITMATGSSEIVRCVCEVEEEDDFMIQCEECLCWQHGTCMGLLEEHVPERYTCYICRDPPGQRRSLRYWYDREWLSTGHMYGLSFLEENYSYQNARKITATHQLLGDVQQVLEVLRSLQMRISVLQNPAHPDLKLWCQPWRPRKKGLDSGAAHSPASWEECLEMDHSKVKGGTLNVQKLSRTSSSTSSSPLSSSSSTPFQDAYLSYISSEHCYQKPCVYYPVLEQKLVVETRGGSDADDVLNGYDRHAARFRSANGWPSDRVKESAIPRLGRVERVSEVKVEDEEHPISRAQQQQWQMNLLDHIESVQEDVCHRMDFIEKELDVLESWLDYTGELEPPEPLARLPQLKRRIKQLLSELSKVQQIAISCSS